MDRDASEELTGASPRSCYTESNDTGLRLAIMRACIVRSCDDARIATVSSRDHAGSHRVTARRHANRDRFASCDAKVSRDAKRGGAPSRNDVKEVSHGFPQILGRRGSRMHGVRDVYRRKTHRLVEAGTSAHPADAPNEPPYGIDIMPPETVGVSGGVCRFEASEMGPVMPELVL